MSFSRIRSTLPLSSSGSASRTTTSRGAHDRGCPRPPSRAPRRGRPGRPRGHHEGHDPVAPLLVGHADHLGRRRPPGCSRSRRGDRRGGHVDPAADDHVVEPAEHLQPAVVVEAAGVGGEEPPVDEGLARSAPGRRRSPRTGSARRSGSGRPSPSATATPSSGEPSYTQPPAVSLEPYVATTCTPAASARRAQGGVDRAAAEQDRVQRPQASTSSGSSSIRCSWVGTSDMKRHPASRRPPEAVSSHQPARARRPASGRRPAPPRRTTPAARAATARGRPAGGPRRRRRRAPHAARAAPAWAARSTRTSRPRAARARRGPPASRPARRRPRAATGDRTEGNHATNASPRWNNAAR